jgi:hypothetical protein
VAHLTDQTDDLSPGQLFDLECARPRCALVHCSAEGFTGCGNCRAEDPEAGRFDRSDQRDTRCTSSLRRVHAAPNAWDGTCQGSAASSSSSSSAASEFLAPTESPE